MIHSCPWYETGVSLMCFLYLRLCTAAPTARSRCRLWSRSPAGQRVSVAGAVRQPMIIRFPWSYVV